MNVPPELAESLGVGIAASSLVEIGSLALSEANTATREQFSERTIQGVGTTFEETLRSRIAAVDEQRDSHELAGVLDNWEEVTDRLDTEALPATTTTVATEQIVEAIADSKGFDVSKTPQLRPKMEEAVEEAYADAIDKLCREIEQTDVEYQLLKNDRQILYELERLVGALRPTKGYRLRDAETETLGRLAREVVAMGGAESDVEFVNPEVKIPDSSEVLILGPGGVGKTRLMGELLKRRGASDEIEHIVVPKRDEDGYSLTDHHLEPLDREPFEGDVLLVWDDVSNSGPNNDSKMFEKAVKTLRGRLRDQGHELHVLGTARSGSVDLDAVERNRSTGFWSWFDPVYLEWENPETTAELVDRMLDEYGVTLGDEGTDEAAVKEALVGRTLTAATPGYAEAVLTVAGERLTMADVEDLPENQIELWREQFEALGTESREYATLRVLKLLSELNLTPFRRLVCAVGEAIFDFEGFSDAVDKLVDQRWVRELRPEKSDAIFIHLHDVRAAAVEFGDDRWIYKKRRAVSEFLRHHLDHAVDLPRDFDSPARLHNAIGVAFAKRFNENYNKFAEQHFERAIAENGGTDAEARYNYALLLHEELGRPKAAEQQYRQAIADNDDTFADARNNYGLLLKNELERLEDAENQFRQAIEDNDGTHAEAHYNYAQLLNDELGLPEDAEDQYQQAIKDNDGTDAEARNNYALLLEEELGRPEDAEEQYRQAITDNDGTYANARNNYANLLYKELRRPEDAEEQYRQAIEDNDGTDAETRYNYALLLENELGRPEDAEDQYRKAIEDNDGTFAKARNNYALLLEEELGRPEDAEEQYRQAIEDNDGTYAEAHYNYALLLEEELRRPEDAEGQYRQAIKDNDGTFADARYNYANLLYEGFGRLEDAEQQYRQAIVDNDGPFPEAHFNLGTLLKDLERLEEAYSHVEKSISLWRERGNFGNAINDYRTLVQICAKQNDHDAAVEHAADGLALCVRIDNSSRHAFAEVISDAQDDAASETLACHAYRAALWCVSNGHGITAHRLFTVAFKQREAADGEPRRRAYSAGVGLAALHDVAEQDLAYDATKRIEYDDPDVLLEDVADHASDLRPPVVDCLTLLTGTTADGTETQEVDDALQRREESAFGKLTSLAM